MGDVFGSGRDRLEFALERIAENGNGALIYLRTARAAAASPSMCEPPLPAHEERIAHEILADLGIRHVRRMATNSPDRHIDHPQSA